MTPPGDTRRRSLAVIARKFAETRRHAKPTNRDFADAQDLYDRLVTEAEAQQDEMFAAGPTLHAVDGGPR